MNFYFKFYLLIILILLNPFFISTSSTGAETPEMKTPGDTLQPLDSYLPATGEEINRLLAVVENEAITLRDYRSYFGDTDLTRGKLNKMVDKKLIDIAKKKLVNSRVGDQISSRVRKHIERMKEQEGNRSFNKFLEQRKLSEEEFTSQMINQQKMMILLNRVFPEALQNKPGPTALIKGRLMIFPNQSTAKTVYGKLQQSPTRQTWNHLFEKYSSKPPFLGNKGALDWFHWGTRSREIEFQFFRLSRFEISKPFEQRGSHLIVYKTGLRISPPGVSPTPAMNNAHEELSRRYLMENYRDQLPEKLRQRFTVNKPTSVIKEIKK